MRYFGLKPDGGEIALPAPAEAELDSADDVPADGQSVLYLLDSIT